MTFAQLAFPMAATACVLLAAAVLIRGQQDRRELALAIGLLGFAVEALAAYVLVGWTDLPEERAVWLRIVTTLGVLLPVPWIAFIAWLLAPAGRTGRFGWRLALGVSGGIAATAGALTWLRPPFLVSDLSGPFYAARLTDLGLYAVIAQLLGTIGILAGLELCLRTATRDARWRLKYLVLGLGGVFLVRFYLLSHLLLFHVLLGAYLTTQAAALVVATAAIGLSAIRAPLTGASFTMSRSMALRSAMISLLGLYLFVIGGLGWLLDRVGMSEDLFWGSLLVFAGGTVAGALVLSEDLRWRLKRFVALHFYRSKYDYRTQWMTFTRRLGSTLSIDELAPEMLAATMDAIGTAKGILYLNGDESYHLAGEQEVFNAPAMLNGGSPIVQRAQESVSPVSVQDHERPDWFPQASLLVPLIWQGQLTGFMLVAAERSNAPYAAEDLEFLATMSVQVAATIMTTRLSETVARTREFEAFHRLTSFVVHDLKNAVSSLSLLSQNALQHFDDPEFQRDAIKTLSKTVERMRALLKRLASTAEVPTVDLQPLDLGRLLMDRVVPLIRSPHVKLELDLHPTPVLGDFEGIERVFHNLVINAVEALDGGGELSVRCATRGDEAVCEVADTGCGMSSEFLRRSLFVPFRSGKKGGWGIGLYHAREIVHAHGGRIEVHSEEGRGTTFTVTFPAAGAQAPEPGP